VYKKLRAEGVTMNSVRNNLYYDLRKLKGIGQALNDLLAKRQYDFNALETWVDTMYKKYSNQFDIDEYLILDLSAFQDVPMYTDLTSSEFKQFLSDITPYTLNAVRDINKLISPVLGYIRYLSDNQNDLTGVNLARFTRLKNVVNPPVTHEFGYEDIRDAKIFDEGAGNSDTEFMHDH
jgi:hypothetical protein